MRVARDATTEVVRQSFDAAGAVINGRRTYDLTNGCPVRVPCLVVTPDMPSDVPDGPTQFTFVTDGIDGAVGHAKAVAGEKDEFNAFGVDRIMRSRQVP